MKSTSLGSLVPVLVLLIQLASSDFVPVWPRDAGQLLGSIQSQRSVPLGRSSSSAAARGLQADIFERQEECENTGYVVCSNMPDYCCPAGYNCFTDGCCAESPSGLEPCPGDSQWCYNPSTDICCPEGSCQKGYSCCTNECCASIAYCASDGYCSACPDATETETITSTSTTVRIVIVTVTEVEEPEEASDFSCFPVTVTNSQGATLELDTDCALSYSPASTTTASSTAAAAAAPAVRKGLLWGRQASLSCTPFETDTEFVTVTSMVTRQSTSTSTKTVAVSESEFSCPTMAVTNAAGDVLSLDDSCALEFMPAATSSTSAGSTAGGNNNPTGSSNGNQRSGGNSIQGCGAHVWRMLAVGLSALFII